MKRAVSFFLAISMIVSLFVFMSLNSFARVYDYGEPLAVSSAVTPPDVTDGLVDSSYAEIFDMTGKDVFTWYGEMDDHAPVGYNSNYYRYDSAENPAMEDSEWYNTRLRGYASWDSEKLYFCMVVNGSGELNDNPEVLWYGDGIQFAVYSEDNSPGTVEYTFAQSEGELKCKRDEEVGLSLIQKMFAYGSEDRTTGEVILPEGGVYEIGETIVVYEFAFEWDKLGVDDPSAGMSIPFDVSINMNDENMIETAFCGFQVGCGIFNEPVPGKPAVRDSVRFMLTEDVVDNDYSNVTDETPDGIRFDPDGEIRYYVDDIAVAAGLVQDEDGYYYFINSSKKAVRDCDYSFSESAANGLMPAGKYSFDENGRMIFKYGIVHDDDGEIRYYDNNQPIAAGLVQDDDGDFYFFNSTKKAVRDCDYAFNDSSANGLMPAGKYSFDEDGKMIINQGLVHCSDGEVRYYENGVSVAKGLVRDSDGSYYFVNSTKKAVKNCYYAFSQENANGLLPAGKYFFDSDGKLVIENPDLLPADQDLITNALASVPRYLDQYYTADTASAVKEAVAYIEANRDSMNFVDANNAVAELEKVVSSLEYKESDILQIFITTTNNETIPTEYIPCSVAVVPSSKNETEFLYDADSKVKVRGNSTALADKKPYNFKFSSKENLCGMGKSKKWSLLANAYDKALIRNSIALQVGEGVGVEYTSSSTFVDVWVDGQLMGNFMLVESVDVEGDRVDIDIDNGDYLLEYEAHREESDVTYVQYGNLGMRFAINEPEEPTREQLRKLEAYISDFEDALMSYNWSRVRQVADIDSFVDFYIASEFIKQVDFAFSSTRFYIQDGIFHAGPGWDFDLSMGNVGARLYDDYYLYNNVNSGTYSGNSWEGLWCYKFDWFEYLLGYSEFRKAVEERFAEVAPVLENTFRANELGESMIDELLNEYSASFERNYTIWSITEDDIDDELAVTRDPDPTFEENVEYLRTWLENRYEYLSKELGENFYDESLDTVKNGIIEDEDGEIRYYSWGTPIAVGLVMDDDGNYYFINSTKKAVKDCYYAFNSYSSNGLLPAGEYLFGPDGKMVMQTGLVFKENGDIVYYENGIPTAKGLVQDSDGSYYFINGTKKAVKDCYYAFNEASSNGLLPSGKYYFGADGKLVMEN